MSEITVTFRATIITLMIISGAINTIGNTTYTQPTSSKTRKWSSRGSSISTSFTPTCKYKLLHAGSNYVLRISSRTPYLLHHEEKR